MTHWRSCVARWYGILGLRISCGGDGGSWSEGGSSGRRLEGGFRSCGHELCRGQKVRSAVCVCERGVCV